MAGVNLTGQSGRLPPHDERELKLVLKAIAQSFLS